MTRKPLLRLRLCKHTDQALEDTSRRTHISKSELIRLALNYALPYASRLDLASRKSIGATEYNNTHVSEETYRRIKELATSTASAKVASVARALIKYAVEKDRYYLPIQ